MIKKILKNITGDKVTTHYAISHIALHINKKPTIQQTEHQISHQALMWHTDWHGSSFVKLFILSPEFDEEHGTHGFIPGSHRYKPLGYADTRYSNDYKKNCPEAIEFQMSIGDILIENTSGIHKGIIGKGIPRACIIVTLSTSVIDGKFEYSLIESR